MADAGFYRGTSSEQDSRFTDKERKLLKQMRFEEALDEKICMDRVNLDVLKPWITAKLNDILGLEDDVVIEYVFSQLEEKSLNPKVMQINLTGFLNARRAREFMGELWSMLIEAQSSEDGIPTSLVEKKMKEIQEKAKNISVSSSNGAAAEVAGSDWKNRYDSLTGGRYGNRESKATAEGERSRKDDDRHKSHRDSNRDRENDRNRESGRIKDDDRIERKRGEDKQFKDEKLRSHSRSPTRRHFHDERMERKKERYRSPNRSPPRRKFTERKEESRRRSRSNERRKRKRSVSMDLVDEKQRKKKKKHSKKHASDSDSERAKRRKKHKKEKKRKKHNSSDSD